MGKLSLDEEKGVNTPHTSAHRVSKQLREIKKALAPKNNIPFEKRKEVVERLGKLLGQFPEASVAGKALKVRKDIQKLLDKQEAILMSQMTGQPRAA